MRRNLPIAFFGFIVSSLVCAGLAIFYGLRGEGFWAAIAGAACIGCAAMAALISRPGSLDMIETFGSDENFLSPSSREAMHGDNFIPPEPPAPGQTEPGISSKVDPNLDSRGRPR